MSLTEKIHAMPDLLPPSIQPHARPALQRPHDWQLLARWLLAGLLTALLASAHAQSSYPPAAPPDPPARVAWLGLAEGDVSLAPAEADGSGEAGDWQPALLNRPLVAGDRLWSGARARTELHIGSTAVRMAPQTGLDFVALDDQRIQLRLAQGTLQLRVRTLFDGQRLEIDTPNLAFIVTQPGHYRLDVDPAGDTSRVVAQSGGGWLYGDSGQSLAIDGGEQGNFTGTSLIPAAPGPALQDRFDQWTAERDRAEDQSISARYLPRETVGYQQLDRYGDWQQDATYGAVWLPRSLPDNWAPYRTGVWRWISPWGWTWIDEAPWGFAPFHYGRWAQIGPRWAWVPGRLPQRPVYAPALVAFVGDSGRDSARPLGWFPLAPGEAFRPAYRSSPRYLNQLNHNMLTHPPSGAGWAYRHQRQPGAVSALSREDFARGRPVRGHLQPFSSSELNQAPVVTDHRAWLPRPVHDDQPRRLRPPPLVHLVQPPFVQPPLTRQPPPAPANPPSAGRDRDGHDRRPWSRAPERASERPNEAQREPHAPRTGRPEAWRPEAGRPGQPETWRPEAGRPGRPETRWPEAGRPETWRPEAGKPEPAGRVPRPGAAPTPTPAPPQAVPAPAPATPANRLPPAAGPAPVLTPPILPPAVVRAPPVPTQNTGAVNLPTVRRDPPQPAPERETAQPAQRKPQAQERQAAPPAEAGRPQRRRLEDEPRQPREP